jgi:hypothetical protein
MCFNACEFWMTSLSAVTSDFTPLSLCAEKNHLTISIVEIDEILPMAEDQRGIFLNLPRYDFIRSHWPYRSI